MKTKGWNVVELKKGGQRQLLSHLGGRGPGDRSRKCDCEKEETPGLSPYRQWLGGELQQRRSRLGWPSGAGSCSESGGICEIPAFLPPPPLALSPAPSMWHPQSSERRAHLCSSSQHRRKAWQLGGGQENGLARSLISKLTRQ